MEYDSLCTFDSIGDENVILSEESPGAVGPEDSSACGPIRLRTA